MNAKERKQLFQVSGMTCGHCQAAVASAIQSTEGVQRVDVDLKAGQAVVEGSFSDQAIIEAVSDAGYEASAANST